MTPEQYNKKRSELKSKHKAELEALHLNYVKTLESKIGDIVKTEQGALKIIGKPNNIQFVGLPYSGKDHRPSKRSKLPVTFSKHEIIGYHLKRD